MRSCAAEREGLKLFRGDVDPMMPMEVNAVISSPFADGPAEVKFIPFCDLLSVDDVPALPLRFLLMYFSISSASRSRIRFTIGDSELACVSGGLSVSACEGPGEGKVPVLLAEDMLSDRCEWEWVYWLEGDFEGCDVVDDAERDERLVPCLGPSPALSISPLSDVAVVRLPPEPLRIRGMFIILGGFNGVSGGLSKGGTQPHSLPRAAACANTMRLAFLLDSNCRRAESCKVSCVPKLHHC